MTTKADKEIMTTTILTDAEIFHCFDHWLAEAVINFDADELYPVGRAIEQAVLQSPEVQQMRKDAERYRWLRKLSDDGQDCVIEDMYEIALHDDDLDAAIDAAMEKKE